MNMQTERAAVERLLTQYAQALNAADVSAIPSFYTEDGQFMPEGLPALPAGDLLKGGESYFKKVRFHISYSVQDMLADGGYAFVQATAKTTTVDLATGREAGQTSRDFFVLRKERQEWRILRYIFNNVEEQKTENHL